MSCAGRCRRMQPMPGAPKSDINSYQRRGREPSVGSSRGQRSMPSRPSISVFFPAYNDAGTIPSMVLTALLTLRRIADDYEVIVVNDGSQDHTPQLLGELGG